MLPVLFLLQQRIPLAIISKSFLDVICDFKSKSIFSISETGPVERNIGYIPITQPMFKSGISDVGLDVVDFLLWIAKRLFEKKKVPNILEQYYKKYCDNRVNAISMDSVISTYLLPE